VCWVILPSYRDGRVSFVSDRSLFSHSAVSPTTLNKPLHHQHTFFYIYLTFYLCRPRSYRCQFGSRSRFLCSLHSILPVRTTACSLIVPSLRSTVLILHLSPPPPPLLCGFLSSIRSSFDPDSNFIPCYGIYLWSRLIHSLLLSIVALE
jgi:hypothetical protein